MPAAPMKAAPSLRHVDTRGRSLHRPNLDSQLHDVKELIPITGIAMESLPERITNETVPIRGRGDRISGSRRSVDRGTATRTPPQVRGVGGRRPQR